jgi:hypothetical protein
MQEDIDERRLWISSFATLPLTGLRNNIDTLNARHFLDLSDPPPQDCQGRQPRDGKLNRVAAFWPRNLTPRSGWARPGLEIFRRLYSLSRLLPQPAVLPQTALVAEPINVPKIIPLDSDRAGLPALPTVT